MEMLRIKTKGSPYWAIIRLSTKKKIKGFICFYAGELKTATVYDDIIEEAAGEIGDKTLYFCFILCCTGFVTVKKQLL